jgi:nucleotide-binding universal stress UspA family protein
MIYPQSGRLPGLEEEEMSGIVVGVDGSPHSQNALDWALAESALRHVPLTVLAVWPIASTGWGFSGVPSVADEADRQRIQRATQELVDKAVSQRGDEPGRPVTVVAVAGLASDELVKASEGADLLVVAARGTGGFEKLLMGSVSSQVTHHARCPVVVVPGGQAR